MSNSQAFACPCQSGHDYADCCAPYHQGERPAPSAEALMRSRYSAFALGGLGQYLYDTWHTGAAEKASLSVAMLSQRDTHWRGLEIVKSREQGDRAQVEFRAHFELPGKVGQSSPRLECLHERSRFIRQEGHWFYVDGTILPAASSTVSRNAPCPCGSGRKHKRCCGR